MTFDRRNRSIFSNWWWTVDRMSLVAVGVMIVFGIILLQAASPAVAGRIGVSDYFFVERQIFFMIASALLLFFTSLLPPPAIRKIALIGLSLCIFFMIIVLFTGEETKGAKRWIHFLGLSLQPSEFAKPFFAIVTAWLLSEAKARNVVQGFKLSGMLYGTLVLLLFLQPDLGMIIMISSIWVGQMFIAGLPLSWVAGVAGIGCLILLLAYAFLPHVTFRIDSFLASFSGQGNYQVRKSLEAFYEGGMFGKGPGEGHVKQSLPDSHTDFIFAVAGEEMGALACILMVMLYAFVVFRGFRRVFLEDDLFIVYAASGLLIQFGLQAGINMGVALNLLPTKGMTLPFISYGGSSMLAISLAMGFVLALTRRRYGVMAQRHVVIGV